MGSQCGLPGVMPGVMVLMMPLPQRRHMSEYEKEILIGESAIVVIIIPHLVA